VSVGHLLVLVEELFVWAVELILEPTEEEEAFAGGHTFTHTHIHTPTHSHPHALIEFCAFIFSDFFISSQHFTG